MTIVSHGVAIPLPERPPGCFPSLYRRIARFSPPNMQENEAFHRKSGRAGAKIGFIFAQERENSTNYLNMEWTKKSIQLLEILPLFCPSTAPELGKMLTFLVIRTTLGCKRTLQPAALKSTSRYRGIAAPGAQIDHLFDSIWTFPGTCETPKNDPPPSKKVSD